MKEMQCLCCCEGDPISPEPQSDLTEALCVVVPVDCQHNLIHFPLPVPASDDGKKWVLERFCSASGYTGSFPKEGWVSVWTQPSSK